MSGGVVDDLRCADVGDIGGSCIYFDSWYVLVVFDFVGVVMAAFRVGVIYYCGFGVCVDGRFGVGGTCPGWPGVS